MEDPTKGTRTIDEIKEVAKSKKRGVEKYGCANPPLFPTIPCCTRYPSSISDVLINPS